MEYRSVSNYHDITSSNPIENLLGDPNDFSHKDSVGHFRFPKVYTSRYFFELDFPYLVAMTAVRIIQRRDSNHGTWMVRCYNEKTGVFDDLISSRGFNWTGKDLLVQLNENVGKKYVIALVEGRTTPNVDIHPLIFNFREAYF